MVIEMNPRVSRSSALASKATGFPIAKIAARLAVGYALEEIDNDITLRTPASFEPTIDYVVVKWPRFAFEKFSGVDERLSTHMKSVGEVMAIGRTFQQAFAKAMRSRELDSIPSVERHVGGAAHPPGDARPRPLRRAAGGVRGRRRRRGDRAAHEDRPLVPARARRQLAADPEAPFAGTRTYKSVDTCAAEFAAETPYYYSSWERFGSTAARRRAHEVRRGDGRASSSSAPGPNRIGQGIEFDYCCVHAAMTVRESGRDAVMVNCNPETVSTDYDTSDRLYFEPLTLEDVLGVVEIEQPEGVIVQFGGQTPLKLAAGLQDAGVPILGTSVDAIDLAEDRGRFGALLARARLRGAAVRHGARRRRGAGGLGDRRLPAARAPELRARRARDGDRLLAPRTSPTTCAARRRLRHRHGQARDLPRPLPGERDRGRRRRALRRRVGLDRRRSCSTSRRPASTPATAPACCRRTRSGPRCSTRSASTRAASRSA